jgi:DNA-binding response OmpR family regulator
MTVARDTCVTARHDPAAELVEAKRKLSAAEAALREARAIIAEQEQELDLLRVIVGSDQDPRRVAVVGLTRLQAVVLAMLADGRVHMWWGLAEGLEILIGTESQHQEGLIRTVICKLRAFLRQQGLSGAIVTHNRVGYRIAPDHLPHVRALLWPP